MKMGLLPFAISTVLKACSSLAEQKPVEDQEPQCHSLLIGACPMREFPSRELDELPDGFLDFEYVRRFGWVA